MISLLQPLPSGNAIRIFLTPPPGAVQWRVLRKGADTFTGPDDDEALAVYEGDDRAFVDAAWLQNEVPVCYRPYYWTAGAWVAGSTSWSTPVASYEELSTDVLPLLRERLDQGLTVEVERGEFTLRHGHIQVLTSPPAVDGSLSMPVVTVHLDSEVPAVRGVGEDLAGDHFDLLDDEWHESEGWLAQVQLSVIAWSLNPDERNDLRRALRRIIVANLPVFADAGLVDIEFRAQHVDALSGEYGTNLYQALCTFSCMAPVRVGSTSPAIRTAEMRLVRD